MSLSAFFEGLQPQNNLVMFLYSMKHSYLLTAKITPDINKSNFSWCEVATVGYSLYVGQNFWYLIMASNKY